MTWVKLDDGFYDHPKVVQAGTRAIGLWATALGWANRHKSDGFVPKGIIRRLTDEGRPGASVKRLVEAGLWHEVDGGYRIHDFDDYQPTRAEAFNERTHLSEVRSEAGRMGARIREERRRAATAGSVSASCSASDENAITICDRTRSDSGQVPDTDRVRIQDTDVQAKHGRNTDKNTRSVSCGEKQTGSKPEAKLQANRKQTGSPDPDPDPVYKTPPPTPNGGDWRGQASEASEADLSPATESGTFAVSQNRPEASLEGIDGGIGTIEHLPPLPDPAPTQEPGCGKVAFRDLGTRRFEAPNVANAYASGIVDGRKQNGEANAKYGVSAKHQRALDDAVDTHAPSQREKFVWLKEAATLFARYGFDGPDKLLSYEPTSFAAWLNGGHLAKAKAKEAAERARQEKAKLYLYTPKKPVSDEQRLRDRIEFLRAAADACERNNTRLSATESPADYRAKADELEVELRTMLETARAHHG